MSEKILIGYATKSGSTEEVAEAIAHEFGEQGFNIDLLSVERIKKLDGYKLIVLGAPLYMMRWHKDMRQFLKNHQKVLTGTPIAIFALGPTHDVESEFQSAISQLDKELEKFKWLKPIEKKMFIGKFDPSKIGFPFSLIGPLKNMPLSDERNWGEISSWASSLAEALKLSN
jgi:menaquinone-dependent protoporphyrinogen oxidase